MKGETRKELNNGTTGGVITEKRKTGAVKEREEIERLQLENTRNEKAAQVRLSPAENHKKNPQIVTKFRLIYGALKKRGNRQ